MQRQKQLRIVQKEKMCATKSDDMKMYRNEVDENISFFFS